MSGGYEVCLRIHSGVPIVDVLGEWSAATAGALADMIGALANAGHFEIVINVQRAALDGASALRVLARMAQTVRSHCGHLDLVGTAEQIEDLLRQTTGAGFRLFRSEETAIGHIKRTPVLATGPRFTARTCR
jgi:anti-sigma B factor antagonist